LADDEVDVWANTASAGWGAAAGDFMLDVARVNAGAPDGHLFLAEFDGRPIATAVLAIHGGVAHFAGASTIPKAAATAHSSRCSTRGCATPRARLRSGADGRRARQRFQRNAEGTDSGSPTPHQVALETPRLRSSDGSSRRTKTHEEHEVFLAKKDSWSSRRFVSS
jgi:hypothetical protein